MLVNGEPLKDFIKGYFIKGYDILLGVANIILQIPLTY